MSTDYEIEITDRREFLKRSAALAVVMAPMPVSYKLLAEDSKKRHQTNGKGKSNRQIWINPNIVNAKGEEFVRERIEELFESAHWETVKNNIDVFEFATREIDPLFVPSETLAKAVNTLKEANISIAVTKAGMWDQPVEEQSKGLISLLTRIEELGGKVEYFTISNAFRHTLTTGRPNNKTQYTVEQAVSALVDFTRAVRKGFPSVKIGYVGAAGWYTVREYPSHYPGKTCGDLPEILGHFITKLEQVGERLEYFHADYPYDNANTDKLDGWGKLKALENVVETYGMRFGVLFNTSSGRKTSQMTDELFFRETVEYVKKYEMVAGDSHDIIIDSWYRCPIKLVPENKPYSFTYLVKEVLKSVAL